MRYEKQEIQEYDVEMYHCDVLLVLRPQHARTCTLYM